jgi:hypothetical protein
MAANGRGNTLRAISGGCNVPEVMGPFIKYCNETGVSRDKDRPKAIRRSFSALVHETILFLALGHDYWYKPKDLKALGLHQAFISGPDSWPLTLNISKSVRVDARNLWGDPRANLHFSEYNKFKNPGGFTPGGAGNYNLMTKTLDLVMTDLAGTNLVAQVQAGSTEVTHETHRQIVDCYKYLRTWWDHSLLLKIGLLSR